MINKDKLKVGQKVKLIKEKELNFRPLGGFNSAMGVYLNEEVTIEKLNYQYFKIKEDGGMWIWDYKLIAEEEKSASKVHSRHNFCDEDYILPCDYSLIKVIENGNAVICFVEDENKGRIIKTVSICQEGDTFDLHKGVEICMYKTLRKIADRELKKY